jgi:undecaprenyl-diphosphatase
LTTTQAVVLGIVQGLTEFLPVSSSGHLVIMQHLFGINGSVMSFDIAVHVGTLGAVMVYFAKDIAGILSAAASWTGRCLRRRSLTLPGPEAPDVRMAMLIVVGSIPTAVLGLAFKDAAEQWFSSITIVGVTLCITAALLWGTRGRPDQGHGIGRAPWRAGFWIGLVQGLAIVPGISRSGATIAAGLYLGLNRETAARYSFLLSIPAVAGAGVLGAMDLAAGEGMPLHLIIIGLLTSAVVGYTSLALLIWLVKRGRMHVFAPYCALAGAAALLMGWM